MLDEHGCVFYRAGVTKEAPYGVEWSRASDAKFLATSLSVSNLANLVFCVGAQDGCVYFWESANEVGWKKMSLEFKHENRCPPDRPASINNLNSTGDAEDSSAKETYGEKQTYVDENLDIYENERNSHQFQEFLRNTNLESRLKAGHSRYLHISLLKKNTVETIVSEMRADRADSFIERIRKENEMSNANCRLISLQKLSNFEEKATIKSNRMSDHGK